MPNTVDVRTDSSNDALRASLALWQTVLLEELTAIEQKEWSRLAVCHRRIVEIQEKIDRLLGGQPQNSEGKSASERRVALHRRFGPQLEELNRLQKKASEKLALMIEDNRSDQKKHVASEGRLKGIKSAYAVSDGTHFSAYS